MHGMRAGADERLPEVVDRRRFDQRVGVGGAPVAVVVVDVVTVNLDAADLAAVGEHLRRCVRSSDAVGRLSPRQLAFTCPAAAVHAVTRRLRTQLGEPIRLGDRARLLTFTITHASGSPEIEDLVWRAAVESQAEAHKVMHELFSRTMSTTTTVDELGSLVACSGATFGARGLRLTVEDRVFEAGDRSGSPDLRLDLGDGPGQRRLHESWSDLDPAVHHPAFVSALRSALAHQVRRVLDLEEATRIAHTDPLTGVRNRAGIHRALAGATAMAVAIVDLDHFKAVNDRFGHDAGDRVLAAIGRLLAGTIPDGAVVGRWGGEEFLVAWPGDRLLSLRALAEELCARCRADVVVGGEPVTVSIGVAAGATFDAARAVADRALYEAKAAGRDRVAVALPVSAS